MKELLDFNAPPTTQGHLETGLVIITQFSCIALCMLMNMIMCLCDTHTCKQTYTHATFALFDSLNAV